MMAEAITFKVRRQLPYLTRFTPVRAASYEELARGARSALGLAADAEVRLVDLRRYTDVKPDTDLAKCGAELGLSLASEPRISPAKQKDAVAALRASVALLLHHAREGRAGYAEVSLDCRFESSPTQPLFCNVVHLLSFPPYIDLSYPVDWQRLVALRFNSAVGRYFVVHWCHQHVVMCMHPADVVPELSRDTPLAELSAADVEAFVCALKSLSGPQFWETLCKSDEETKVLNALLTLARASSWSAPEMSPEWCAMHAEVFAAKTACGLNLLHYCCFLGKPAWLKFIAAQPHARRAHIDIDDTGGACALTPLAIAASLGHLEAVECCISLGAAADKRLGVEGQKDYQATALFLAAREGRADVCAYLVRSCGADVNAQLADGSRALAATRDPAIVQLLLESGAAVESLVTKTNNMLWTGYEKDPALDLLRLFLAHGAARIVNAKAGYMDETPLSHICQTYGVRTEQALECARLLVRSGANVNLANKDGLTPLQTVTAATWAPSARDMTEQFVALLLDAGANWRGTEGKGRSPLDRCIDRGDWRSVVHFVRHGAALSRHQKQEVAQRADAETVREVARAADEYAKREKQTQVLVNRKMNMLLAELGEGPARRNKKKEREKEKKKPARRKVTREPASTSASTGDASSSGSESSDEDVGLCSGGKAVMIAATTSSEQAESGADDWCHVTNPLRCKKDKKKQARQQQQQQQLQQSESATTLQKQAAQPLTSPRTLSVERKQQPQPQPQVQQLAKAVPAPTPTPTRDKLDPWKTAHKNEKQATTPPAVSAAPPPATEEAAQQQQQQQGGKKARRSKQQQQEPQEQQPDVEALMREVKSLRAELEAERETSARLREQLERAREECVRAQAPLVVAPSPGPPCSPTQDEAQLPSGLLDLDSWVARMSCPQPVWSTPVQQIYGPGPAPLFNNSSS
eukprot:m51a1_g8561 putative ankyrin-3 isoform x1 (926) ;mRNA; r:172576-176147